MKWWEKILVEEVCRKCKMYEVCCKDEEFPEKVCKPLKDLFPFLRYRVSE